MHFILDFAIVMLFGLCAFLGAKRGLVLSLSRLLSVLIALVVASMLAAQFSPLLSDAMEPYVRAAVKTQQQEKAQNDDKAKQTEPETQARAPDGGDPSSENEDGSQEGLWKTVRESLNGLGVYRSAADAMTERISQGSKQVISSVQNGVSAVLSHSISYILVFSLSFFLTLLILSAISHALNLVFRLPVLNLFNKVGGLAFGALEGLLILFLVAWILRYLGTLIPEETVEQTTLLRFLMETNPIAWFSGV